MRIGSVAEDDFALIPKVRARLSAGDGSFEVDGSIKGYCMFRNSWLKEKGHVDQMVLMDIFGNSMEPAIRDGDMVLVDCYQKDILAGAIFAVGIDDTIMVKRIEKHPGKLVLISDNPDYAPIHLGESESESVRVIGKVIWLGRGL
jgi:phage repressor protein C with HTH and peptisase S24 domain